MGDCDADLQEPLLLASTLFLNERYGASVNDNSASGPRLVEADTLLILFLPENLECVWECPPGFKHRVSHYYNQIRIWPWDQSSGVSGLIKNAGYGRGRSQAFQARPQAQPDPVGSSVAYTTSQALSTFGSQASVLPHLSLARKEGAWGKGLELPGPTICLGDNAALPSKTIFQKVEGPAFTAMYIATGDTHAELGRGTFRDLGGTTVSTVHTSSSPKRKSQ